MKKIYFLLFGCLLLCATAFSQVTVTNPTNTTPNLAATYTSLANAITALDAITAISGPVTITLNAGNPETAPAGGYVIQFAAQTTATNTVTISGSNNAITASAALVAGRLYDGIFKIIGADYITIQNFTMQENPANTTTAAATNNMTEWGVAMLHSSTIDGPQHNTIQNNTISLNRTYQNTFGIYSNGRHSATTVTTTENIIAGSGSQSANKVYGNNISNVCYGIVFVGSATSAFMDDGNDIGGSSAATGNTITNWGQGTAVVSGYVSVTTSGFCIYANHQINENISYNTITSATVTGGTFTFGGILKAYSTASASGTITSTINNNTITLSSTNASGTMDGILNQNLTALSTATFSMNNNLITNCSISAGVTSSAFGGIIHSSAPGVLNITNNIIRGLTSTSTTGGYNGISNSGAVVTTINITNNQIGDAVGPAVTFSAANPGATITGISNSGAAATATVNLNNNTIDGFTCVNASAVQGIINTGGNNATININNNSMINATINGAGAATNIVGFNNSANAGALSISSNVIRSNTSTAVLGGFTGIVNTGAVVNSITITNNQIGNAAGGAVTYSVGTSGLIYGINIGASAITATVNVNNNSIDGISLVTCGAFQGIFNGSNAATANINNNQLGSVTGNFVTFSGAQSSLFLAIVTNAGNVNETVTIQGNDIKGIVHGVIGSNTYQLIASNSAVLSQTVSSNTFSNLSLNTTGSVTFIVRQGNMASGASWTCNNNSIVTGFTKGSPGGNVIFIYSVSSSIGGSTMTTTNNTFSNVTVAGATFVWGINDQEGSTVLGGPAKTITGNIISNISAPSGLAVAIQVDRGSPVDCSSNTISNVLSSNDVYGINHGVNIGSGMLNIASNNISTLSSTSGSAYGIFGGNTIRPQLISTVIPSPGFLPAALV